MPTAKIIKCVILTAALAMVLPATPGFGQSTCICPSGTYAGLYGMPHSLTLVNPAYSTCRCGQVVRAGLLDRPRNTADEEWRMARVRSLPEQEYVMWARAEEERLQREDARVRAASIPRAPVDPLLAAEEGLASDTRTAPGSYRPRIEKGDLVLRGEVATVYMRDRALALAGETSGMEVRDELRVTSLGRVPDEHLQAEVERTLAAAGLDDYEVEVAGGVVQTRPPLSTRKQEVLLQVPGVRSVH